MNANTTPPPEGLAPASGSVIRVRYLVDVQSVSGTWQNMDVAMDEERARFLDADWKNWLNDNRKTWKATRIIKEVTTHEVLQNDERSNRGSENEH